MKYNPAQYRVGKDSRHFSWAWAGQTPQKKTQVSTEPYQPLATPAASRCQTEVSLRIETIPQSS